ncbi:MAG: family 78 glycoside hydrolase catalytic domain [Phycisphaerae bacterium]|nr:family 78 glycoside hydrolase catalytic domain [Phycisphaerae bacterium]
MPMNLLRHPLACAAWLLVLLCTVLPMTGCGSPGSLRVSDLRAEYRTEPLGLGTTSPRLSWELKATSSGARNLSQAAYQVLAATSPQLLAPGKADLWDTGRVESRATNQIEYAGKSLASRSLVHWRVRVWDQANAECGWSTPASFSIGLLDQSEWKAEWIGLDDGPKPPLTQDVRDELRAMPWIRLAGPPARAERDATFRSEFEVRADSVVSSAFFAGTADMIADVSINARAVGQLTRWNLLTPIDAGAALAKGTNTIAIRVVNHDGFNPAVTGQLYITYADGQVQRVPFNGLFKLFEGLAPTAADRVGFDATAWTAVEVVKGQPWGGNRNTEHYFSPAPYLRTTFATPPGKAIARATLYSTALGVYWAEINGQRVSNDLFTPGWTDYNHRVYHQTYDVTGMLSRGENCLGAVLGDGWYAGLMGYTGQRHYYGQAARFRAQLEITYTDGTSEVITTGPSWRAAFGPIRATDNYMGSIYDSRLEIPGWSTSDFDASKWSAPAVGVMSRAARRAADVTAKIASKIENGRLSLAINPQNLGDPAYQVVKTLDVEYTIGGQKKSITLREGETLSLPRAGEIGDLSIVRAIFGEPEKPVPAFVIEPQPAEPVRHFESLPAISVSEPRPGRFVFDLGQNMVGWTRLNVSGKAGQTLTVRHAEFLNPDGTLYTSNLRGATATDFFTLKGGRETIEPPFTFHGFRYVEITGLDSRPSASMVTGIVAHSDMPRTGEFATSDPLVNQLFHNIIWGQKGNYFEVPTDCPQRDERLGWTGDAQFFIKAASYNFDIASFMSRWLKTLAHDAQFEDGTFAHVAPKVNERGGSTAWGDAAIVCTNWMYHAYGDTRIIRENYGPMKRYMTWLDSKTTNGIAKVGGFGDWVNLGDPTSQDLIDTAYRAELLRMMSEMARVIGKSDDSHAFDAARDETVKAFQARFLAEDGSLRESGQTGYALAFTMGLIPHERWADSAKHYTRAIEKKNFHLATGFIGTPRLLTGLHNAGRDDVAHRLLFNDDYPSWLYQVKLGATTMWERWDGWTPERGFQDVGMNSFNHYAFGAVGDYLFGDIAGIRPLEPGFAKVRIAPVVVPRIGHGGKAFDQVSAKYRSIAGTIESSWRWVDGRLVLRVVVPPNVVADVALPIADSSKVRMDGREIESTMPAHGKITVRIGSGEYEFEIQTGG